MKYRQAILSAAVTSAACFVVGLALGKQSNPTGEIESGDSPKSKGLTGRGEVSRLTALTSSGGNKGSAMNLTGLVSSSEFGLYEKFCGYFRVISGATAEEMPSLIDRLRLDLPDEMGRDMFVEMATARWVKLDPGGAFDAFLCGRPKGLDGSVEMIVAAAVEQGPGAAWERMLGAVGDPQSLGLGTVANRDRAIGVLLKSIQQTDPQLAVSLLDGGSFPAEFEAGLVLGLEEIASKNPGLVLDLIENKSSFLNRTRGLVTVAFDSLAAANSPQALSRLAALEPAMRPYALNGIARGWGQSDPAAAFEWASQLTGGTGNGIEARVLMRWGEHSPADAAAVLAEVSSPQVRKEAARSVVDQWANSDRAAAFEWAKRELEAETRVGAYGAILSKGIDSDFDENFEMYRELVEEVKSTGWAEQNFVRKWAHKDARAAVEWAAGLESGGRELIEPAFAVWASSDLAAARGFAARVEDEDTRSTLEAVLKKREGGR